jgi:hypothetical protein
VTFYKIYRRGKRETSAAGRPIKLLKDKSTETGDWSVKKVSLSLLLLASLAKLLFNYEHHINVKPSNVHHQTSVVRKGTAAIFFILQ